MTLTKLLHDITQLNYEVQFCSDFNGMVRVEIYDEYDVEFYKHAHLGSPDCTPEFLEKKIFEYLDRFSRDAKDNREEKK